MGVDILCSYALDSLSSVQSTLVESELDVWGS